MSDIVIEQRIGARPATVYRYLTESDKWTSWPGIGADLDPRIGGVFSMQMASGMRAIGAFIELIPDRRVVFSWGWVDRPGIPPGSTVVEIDLMADLEGTILTLTHRALADAEGPLHEAGWRHYLPRLAIAAVGGHPGVDPAA